MTDRFALFGLEWSGARLSAWAFDDQGEILSSSVHQEPRRPMPEEYVSRTKDHLADWLGQVPPVPVIACGEIGSVLSCVKPVSEPLMLPLPLTLVSENLVLHEGIWLVPWLCQTAPPDLTCGAETVLAGLEEDHASVCLVGRHTRHIQLQHGRVARLSTEITAELRDLLLTGGSLALPPDQKQAFDSAVFREWMERALDRERPPSAYAVEAAILMGQLDPSLKAAAIAGLLIGADVAAHYDPGDEVLLVADGPLREAYGLAFDALGADVEEISALGALQDGLFELADLAGLLG